jgi:uncharacterized protein YbjT (DUF2867 family)
MRIAVAGATGRVGRHTVDALSEQGHDVVPMSRSMGVDVFTGEGLDDALIGVDAIIDAATTPTPDGAMEFFTTAARNLQMAGDRAGVERIVVVSIIGVHNYDRGYGAAKVAHEATTLTGPVPAIVLRAAQFHEFVEELMNWGRRGDVTVVPNMRTQLVAARSVGEALAELVTDPEAVPGLTLEIAGPREESLVEKARLLAARRGDSTPVEGFTDPEDPEHQVYISGALLPGPYARLAGPTFDEWLEVTYPAVMS